MDISNLAKLIVLYLSPFFPYLLEIGHGYLGKMGEDAWDKTKSLWKIIPKKIKSDSRYREMRKKVSEGSESDKYIADFANLFEEYLKIDRLFVEKVKIVLNQKERRKSKQRIKIDNSIVKGRVIQFGNQGTRQTIEITRSKVVNDIKQIVGFH